MTREEAIEILEKEKAYMLGHGGDGQAVALDMAIKALEQKSCETILEDIKAELQKKEFYIDSTQIAKNVYREAMMDAIEIIDRYIGRK